MLTAMASEHISSGPALHEMTPTTITPEVIAPIDEVIAPVLADSTGSPSSTTVDQDAPSPSNSQTTPETEPPIIPNDVEEDNHDIEVAHMGNDPYFGIPIPKVTSDQSSSSVVIHTIVPPDHQSDEDATYEEDQGNEAVEDTNTDLDGRDDIMTDVILPQVQATQEIEDTHVTLTPVNPDGQQQSSSVSSGFVSNMLNPNQDTGVDDIFGQHTEATSLIDTPVTAFMEPSFTAQINRPPTPFPLVIQTQQPPILTPATTTSSSLQ
ncbi:hypothetical protein Tco_1242372, partial [Tanacetum coccineum]